MPLYEFQCEACDNRFEKIQKYADPLPEVCPKCGKGPVRKLLSSPAIQFKGSGFYITDYPKSSSAGSSPKSSGGSDSSSSDSKSSDSKSSDSKKSDSAPTSSGSGGSSGSSGDSSAPKKTKNE